MRKSDSFSSSPEIKQFLSDVRKISRENKDMEVAPLRTLDDFILTKSRFQVCNIEEIYFLNCIPKSFNFYLLQIPDMNNEDRWFNRIVYNLLYYQTNYLLSALLIFSLVFMSKPQEMFIGLFLMVFIYHIIKDIL